MKKVIVSFLSGQVLQLLLLFVAQKLTYSTDVLAFCGILGALATLLLCVGSGLQLIEMTPAGDDMEETAPISKHLKVTNDRVERVPEKKHKTVGQRIAEARDKLSGTDEAAKEEARAVMETKLSEVGTDV